MRRFWLIFWILLLVLQVLAIWMMRDGRGDRDPLRGMDLTAMIDLGEQTLEAWQRVLENGSPGDRGNPQTGVGLTDREERMLSLRDLEAGLVSRGLDITVAGDLGAWLSAPQSGSRRSLTLDEEYAYIVSLHDLLDFLSADPEAIALRRAALHPGPGSAFPSLAFEGQGRASEMGSLLLASMERFPGWRLGEVDLSTAGPESQWWLRGSLLYGEWIGP